MSTKEKPGPFDGRAKAAPNEPIFTLRAHDPLAPRLVREWVELRRKDIRKQFADGAITEKKRDLELIQCREAEELSWAMDEFRKGEIAQAVQEVKEETPPAESYTGHTSTEEELAALQQFKALERADVLVSNAAASTREAGDEVLASLEMHNERAVLVSISDALKAISKHLRPDRHKTYHPGQPLPEPIDISDVLSCTDGNARRMASDLREAADADPS